MLWSKVDKKWQDRLALDKEGDVSWKKEQWPVPGEEPLEVRVCTRAGFPVSKFSQAHEAPRTSIVLHQTAGYGNFTGLMGGSDHSASAHVLLGRCGTTYLLVPTEFTAWHATWWNPNSIGIEIDCIGPLFKSGNNLVSEYGNPRKDVYCSLDDKDCYVEKSLGGVKYWATMTEAQYKGTARLIKALCFKHKIPRIVLPEPQRYKAFDKNDPKVRQNYRGICTHMQIDPANRADIGPYIDWAKLIQYAGLTEADCYNPPASVSETWQDASGGKVEKAADAPAGGGSGSGSGSSTSPSTTPSTTPSTNSSTPASTSTSPSTPASTSTSTPKPPAGGETLPAPVMIDNHTLRIHVGKHGGRICFSVKQPGDPMPTTPDPGEAPAAKAPGKRDDFIQACMNFLGAPYKAGSKKPSDGIDGAGMIALAMRRVELFKSDDEMPGDAEHLSALWHVTGGDAKTPPEEILPGDLVWFGKGDHDNDPMQHPMVYLGGGRALGPVPDGGANSAVQIIAIEKVPEKFAGWMHVDDLGTETKHTEHPGDPPPAGAKLTGALLPPTPAAQYDALKKIVERAKGKWDDGKGKVNLVGVKSLHDRCLISPKPDDWNDTLFAAFVDEGGHKCVLEMRASLNPGNDSSKAETWQLWEGSWKFKLGAGDSVEKALQPDGKVKGWEDKEGWGAPRPLDHDKPAKADDVQPAAPKGKGDEKPPEPKKPIEEPKDAKPAPPPDKPFVFDAAGKKLSMKFGMRMMRALIDWELKEEAGQLKGTVYSWNGVVQKYPKLAPKRGTEWPLFEGIMQIEPTDKISFGGGEHGVWHAFGVEWVATGATNCCNSQMAAIFASLPDGKMRIKKDDGLLELDVVKGTPAAPNVKVGGKKSEAGYSSVFGSAWVQGGSSGYTVDGKKIAAGYTYITPAYAMKWLGVGDAVAKWGDPKVRPLVRMGDNACWYSHNWLVGDVRYEVTLKGYKTPVYVDQSDFARGDHPQPHAGPVKQGGVKMTKEDCLWVEQNEELFEARLKAFVESKSLEYEGKDYEVTKIESVGVRVFSANCMAWQNFGTARGVIYSRPKDSDGKKADDWSEEKQMTHDNRLGLGISRPWDTFANQTKGSEANYGFARWYDNAGGAEHKPEGGADPKLDVKPPADDGASHG